MGKVKGAKACSIGAIKFKSQLERDTYLVLKAMKLDPKYEEDKVILQEGFSHLGQKCLPVTYTPDFTVSKGRKKVYIECKGHKTEVWRIKRKLFLRWLKDKEPKNIYLEVYKASELVSKLK